MSFATDFNHDQGDLIYGRGEVRSAYLKSLPLDPDQRRALDRAWVFLDNYNNAFGSSGSAFRDQEPATASSTNSYFDKVAELLVPPPVSTSRSLRQEAYYKAIRNSGSRYAPSTVFDIRRGALAKEGWAFPATKTRWFNRPFVPRATKKSEANAYLNNRVYKALRRVCKLGIGLVATEQSFSGAKILFVLDGLNMKEVVSKASMAREGNRAVPITSSELRYVYRHWAGLAGKVCFYVNGQQVAAPWLEDWDLPNIPDLATPPRWSGRVRAERDAWLGYGERRLEKYSGTLPTKGLL